MAVFKPVTEVILPTSCYNSRFILCQTWRLCRSRQRRNSVTAPVFHDGTSSMNWSVVILEDIVLLRKMPCNNWPQIVFEYLLILFGIYISIYKCKSSHFVECKAPPEHNSKLRPGRWCGTLRHPFFTSPSPDVESVICANFNPWFVTEYHYSSSPLPAKNVCLYTRPLCFFCGIIQRYEICGEFCTFGGLYCEISVGDFDDLAYNPSVIARLKQYSLNSMPWNRSVPGLIKCVGKIWQRSRSTRFYPTKQRSLIPGCQQLGSSASRPVFDVATNFITLSDAADGTALYVKQPGYLSLFHIFLI